MTERKEKLHTKDRLADELRKIGLDAMASLAAVGFYHDYLSPLTFPEMQLAADLQSAGSDAALALRQRVIDGEFDASAEESDEWFNSQDGQDALAQLKGTAK